MSCSGRRIEPVEVASLVERDDHAALEADEGAVRSVDDAVAGEVAGVGVLLDPLLRQQVEVKSWDEEDIAQRDGALLTAVVGRDELDRADRLGVKLAAVADHDCNGVGVVGEGDELGEETLVEADVLRGSAVDAEAVRIQHGGGDKGDGAGLGGDGDDRKRGGCRRVGLGAVSGGVRGAITMAGLVLLLGVVCLGGGAGSLLLVAFGLVMACATAEVAVALAGRG